MTGNRPRDLFIEVGVGVSVATLALLYAAHGQFSWMPHRKWVVLAIVTSGVFGVPAWWHRRAWARPPFCLTLLGLLGLHVLGYSMLLARRTEFPPLLSFLSCPMEWPAIFPLLNRVAGWERHGHSGG